MGVGEVGAFLAGGMGWVRRRRWMEGVGKDSRPDTCFHEVELGRLKTRAWWVCVNLPRTAKLSTRTHRSCESGKTLDNRPRALGVSHKVISKRDGKKRMML